MERREEDLMAGPTVKHFVVVVAVALAIPSTADAQQRRTFGRGTVIVGGERFGAEKLVVHDDTLTFVVRASGQPKSYPLSRVEYASRIRTHAREGALAGGGLMLLGGLLGVAQAEADPNLEPRGNAGVIVGALTLGGIVVGGLIGTAFPREKSIIQNGRLLAALDFPAQLPRDSGSSNRALFRVVLRF